MRLFASARELLGAESLDLELADGATVATAKEVLAERAPDFARLPLAQAVNRAYAADDAVLADGDELAFIPPISGGAPEPPRFAFSLHDGELDARALERACRSDRDGALCTFVGVTRDHNDGQRVKGLAYEAYAEMAEPVLLRICAEVVAAEEARGREVGRIRVAHRLGEVPVGEASVVVVVAAPHRGPAFDVCHEVMDRLKKEVPIFKKEWLDDGSGESRWVGELPDPR